MHVIRKKQIARDWKSYKATLLRDADAATVKACKRAYYCGCISIISHTTFFFDPLREDHSEFLKLILADKD